MQMVMSQKHARFLRLLPVVLVQMETVHTFGGGFSLCAATDW